jgi:hypothetical protein
MEENTMKVDEKVDMIVSKSWYKHLMERVNYLSKEVTFWQGKFNILRTENNALRKQMKGLISIEDAINRIVEIDKEILTKDGLEIPEESIRNHYSRILK